MSKTHVKAALIRHTMGQIATWRSERLTYEGMARKLSESSVEISAEALKRETYRARKREKKDSLPGLNRPPTDDPIAERLAKTGNVKSEAEPGRLDLTSVPAKDGFIFQAAAPLRE